MAHEMWTLYMGRSALAMRRRTSFDGPARITAHDMWCTTAAAQTSAQADLPFVVLVQMVDHDDFGAVTGVERTLEDTFCRLRDPGSISRSSPRSARTEASCRIGEVRPERGHPRTEICSDVHLRVCLCVVVKPAWRTGAAGVCEAPAKG